MMISHDFEAQPCLVLLCQSVGHLKHSYGIHNSCVHSTFSQLVDVSYRWDARLSLTLPQETDQVQYFQLQMNHRQESLHLAVRLQSHYSHLIGISSAQAIENICT